MKRQNPSRNYPQPERGNSNRGYAGYDYSPDYNSSNARDNYSSNDYYNSDSDYSQDRDRGFEFTNENDNGNYRNQYNQGNYRSGYNNFDYSQSYNPDYTNEYDDRG